MGQVPGNNPFGPFECIDALKCRRQGHRPVVSNLSKETQHFGWLVEDCTIPVREKTTCLEPHKILTFRRKMGAEERRSHPGILNQKPKSNRSCGRKPMGIYPWEKSQGEFTPGSFTTRTETQTYWVPVPLRLLDLKSGVSGTRCREGLVSILVFKS